MNINCNKPHIITLTSKVDITIDNVNYIVEVTFDLFPDIKNTKERIKLKHISTEEIPDTKYHKEISEYINIYYNSYYNVLHGFVFSTNDGLLNEIVSYPNNRYNITNPFPLKELKERLSYIKENKEEIDPEIDD